MILVIDTNILFTFFWKKSVSKELFHKHVLYAPQQALLELEKYSAEIQTKAMLSPNEFNALKKVLTTIVTFIPVKHYRECFSHAQLLSYGLSPEDTTEFFSDLDFFALAVKLNMPIWSNDKLFKKQTKILIFNTEEIIELTDED